MLPFQCLDSIIYTTTLNVYYSTQSQDSRGRIVRTWTYDRTERALVNPSIKSLQIDSRNEMFNTLKGHSEEDLRIDSEGNIYGIQDVLVTISDPAVYKEVTGPRKGLNTLYEVRLSNPVIGVFGEVLHFDIALFRSADQSSTLNGGGVIE